MMKYIALAALLFASSAMAQYDYQPNQGGYMPPPPPPPPTYIPPPPPQPVYIPPPPPPVIIPTPPMGGLFPRH